MNHPARLFVNCSKALRNRPSTGSDDMTSTTERPARAARPPSWWDRQGDLLMRRPFSEFTFTHMNWLMPTERVSRGDVHRPLPFESHRLDLTYRFEGHDRNLDELHRRTNTTAFVVL